MNPGELLIVKSSSDICTDELSIIRSVAALNRTTPLVVDLTKGEKIEDIPEGHCFDLVYLCGHGSVDGMGGVLNETWEKIAFDICTAACTKDGATVFCACCRGGLRSAAMAFFLNCPSIEYVVGPKSNVFPQAIILGFHAIMYGILFRRSEPDDACEAAYVATGQKFIVHDFQQYVDSGQIELEDGTLGS